VLLKRPADRCDVPLAVVLGKADALPTDDFPFLVALHPSNLPALGEKMHSTCREALEKLGEGRCVRALEQKFSTVRYFACSALGRVPDPRDTSPFQPVGVIDPFLWMMGLNRDRAKSASV